MAGDIEYGYDWQYFDLTDVKIGQSITLSYEDEDLCSQLTDVEGRWLSAKAKICDVGAGSGLYAGVPEDKEHVRHSDKELEVLHRSVILAEIHHVSAFFLPQYIVQPSMPFI